MRIAVCDDDQGALQRITDLIRQYDVRIRVDGFLSAAALLACTEDTSFDAVFLDIEMPEPNGYEAAKTLVSRDTHPLIVFVTHTSTYAVRGYGIAFRYLLKPVDLETLSTVLRDIEDAISADRITLKADGTEYVLSIGELEYAEVLDHVVTLKTRGKSVAFRGTLKELEAQLPAKVFCSPHQSYIVNLNDVRLADKDEIVMKSGAVIPVSRRKRQDFLRRFHAFLGGTP